MIVHGQSRDANVEPLKRDFTTPKSMFAAESELTLYADGTPVVVRGTSRDGWTGKTVGIKRSFPYPYQAVRWDHDGSISNIAPHPLERLTASPEGPQTTVFTINVSGSERHDGEKPYTYVLRAPDMAAAKLAAYRWHLWTEYCEHGTQPAVIPVWRPNGPDVVVIDCREFPCEQGAPASDCGYSWNDLSDEASSPDLDLMRKLGFEVAEYREENTW